MHFHMNSVCIHSNEAEAQDKILTFYRLILRYLEKRIIEEKEQHGRIQAMLKNMMNRPELIK